MAHDQPGRLSGILERIQDMQGLPQTGEMLLGQIQQKAGDAPCMAGTLEQADAFAKTSSGKRIYAWRKETIERSFAEAKELHGLRYARMLGIRNMYEQSFLTAAVQNMKRIARAFRFPFSLLILCIGAAFGRKRPLSQRSASAAPTVCARRPNGRRAQRVEKAGAARLFRHAVAGGGGGGRGGAAAGGGGRGGSWG